MITTNFLSMFWETTFSQNVVLRPGASASLVSLLQWKFMIIASILSLRISPDGNKQLFYLALHEILIYAKVWEPLI